MSALSELRRLAGQVGVARSIAVVALLVVAVLIARFAAVLPLAADAERTLYDVRALIAAPQVEQDDRVTMVVYTDETLERTGKRSPLDRGVLARALASLDALGPKAIAIDILIDQPQDEDPALTATLKAMRTPTYLAFASYAGNAEQVLPWQERFQREFQAAVAGGAARPGSIRLETDPDGVIRSWPVRPADTPPLFANALHPAATAFADYHGAIGFRLPRSTDRPVFASLPIDLFEDPAAAEALKDMVAGRYILIGGDITDLDRFDTPATRITGKPTIGLEVHAQMLAQALDGRLPAAMPHWLLSLAALLVATAGAATAIANIGGWRLGLLVVVEWLAMAALPFALQQWGVDTLPLPAFGWLVGWTIAYTAASAAARGVTSEQRRFAQSTLGRYLPREVATSILREPARLTLKGERRTIYALFSDLEGFTKLTHAVPPETIAALLNRYLDELSAVVLDCGGTLDKFVGDAVVAFWGAPIAHADDGRRAFAAATALAEAGERFRRSLGDDVPPVGRTRVGLHRGEAVVGNFGGEGRIQYTALGDAMNTAARLEGANKQLATRALVSETVLDTIDATTVRPMGRVAVRGRATPLAVFEPVDDTPDARAAAAELAGLVARFDAGEEGALAGIKALAARNPEDAALAKLVYRLRSVGPGGYFGLD